MVHPNKQQSTYNRMFMMVKEAKSHPQATPAFQRCTREAGRPDIRSHVQYVTVQRIKDGRTVKTKCGWANRQ